MGAAFSLADNKSVDVTLVVLAGANNSALGNWVNGWIEASVRALERQQKKRVTTELPRGQCVHAISTRNPSRINAYP